VKDKADYSLDVRETISPFSLLKVSLVFQKMAPQEIVEILGCDREMQHDLLRVLPRDSCEVVRNDPFGKDSEMVRIWLKKRDVATAP